MNQIHALHGFLGLPFDWNGFYFSDSYLISHDLNSSFNPNPWKWAENFNRIAALHPAPRIIMGYSMGGRMAMHSLLHSPHLWHGAIFISAHPGYNADVERSNRLIHDFKWSERFLKEPWDSLLKDWNAQSIFHTTPFLQIRNEENYSRLRLAEMLRCWSLGLQDDLGGDLGLVDVPILWIAGENDYRYAAQAGKMHFKHLNSKIWIASEVAHRVPWECQNAFSIHVEEFLKNVGAL